MAVFLGPRHTTAEEREGRRKPREIAWRAPIGFERVAWVSSPSWFVLPLASLLFVGRLVGIGGKVCDGWTWTGSQPPGAWVILASSSPSRRGMEGPVRSMSRIPTDFPARERDKASWVVTEDLPTPPLPDRTCRDKD